MSVVLAPEVLESLGVPTELAMLVARSVGAHHGAFADARKRNEIWDVSRRKGKRPHWLRGPEEFVPDVVAVLCPAERPSAPKPLAERHAFAVDLAGLTTTADWLGPNADVFGSADSLPNLTELLPGVSPGALVIVEAAMAEGKTEAALLGDDTLSARGSVGPFFALPTRATANQILGRVERYLSTSFEGAHGLHLVHRGAGVSEEYDALERRALRLMSIEGVAGGGDQARVADAWFTRPKRALLRGLGDAVGFARKKPRAQ